MKLDAEVADLSEAMRLALKRGTDRITARLASAIEAGAVEEPLEFEGDPCDAAQSLYQLWLGAGVMAKIGCNTQPSKTAMMTTHQVLYLSID